MCVKKSVFEKLLSITDSTEPYVKKSIARELFCDDFQDLLVYGILIHFKNLKDIEVVGGDHEYIAEIERRDGENVYFSPEDGWVPVNEEDIALYKINYDWLVKQIMNALDIADRHTPKEILKEYIWALGKHRIEKQSIDVVVVRNIRNGTVMDVLIDHLNTHHKSRNPALVIALDQQIPNHLILPNQNELVRIDEAIVWDKSNFELNTRLLAGKMGGTISKLGFSNGYRTLNSNGVIYKFTKKQAEALEYLDNSSGKPCHQDEVLAEIRSNQSKLLQIFRSKGIKHQAWGTIIKGDGNGNYWLDY